jgi:uncharacterized protein with WD repeat
MKKIVLIAVLALFSNTWIFAGNGTGIHNTISKQLKVPQQLKDKKLNENVNVQFKINNNGTIVLLDVKTKNKELKKYVESEFPKLNLLNEGTKAETIYFIDLNFKVL